MNKRIEELINQCTETSTHYVDGRGNITETYFNKEKFATLIIEECTAGFVEVWREQGIDILGGDINKFMKRFDKHFGIKE